MKSNWHQWLLDTSDSSHQAELLNTRVSQRWFIWLLLLLVASLLIWASFAEMDEVVSGSGRIIPASRVQEVQSLDGGILKSVEAQEGSFVKAGQVLLQVDETRYQSSFRVNETELEGMNGTLAQLESEQEAIRQDEQGNWTVYREAGIDFPDGYEARYSALADNLQAVMEKKLAALSSQMDILDRQVEQKRQELNELLEKVRTLSRSVSLIEEEIQLKEPLALEGVVTRVEIIALERKANDLRGELISARIMVPGLEAALAESVSRSRDLVIRYRADLQKELQETRERFNKLVEGQVGLEDRVKKTLLRSPVDGVVKAIYVHTPGSVVQSGTTLVEVVPSDDRLLVEARVQPSDIAFLRPGQKAEVKLTAYEFASYGSLKGEVGSISADTLEDERGLAYYRVKVVVPDQGGELTLLPGMTAVVDILTGKRTVMDYLLSPVLKGFQ